MKQQDVFVIHQRNLYMHRGYSDPSWKDFSFSRTTGIHSETGSGKEKASFIVDWQLQVIEVQGFDKNSTHDTSSDNYRHSVEIKD
jgi:hypothetical protein